MKKIFFVLAIILFVTNMSKAQTAYFGNTTDNDSIECLKSISVYKEFQKLKFIDNAITQWKKTYNQCPGFKKIIYQDGVKFLRYLIKKETDKEQKKVLVDSLMHIYDARIKYFGEKAYLKGKKGLDLYRYDKNRTEEARQLLNESVNELQEKVSPSVLAALIITSETLLKQKKLDDTNFSETYFLCIEILDKQLENVQSARKKKQINQAKEIVQKTYTKAHHTNCDAIEKVLSERFKNDCENVELILKIQVLLKAANCIHTNLYLQTALKLHQLKPNAANAYILAGLLLKNEQFNNAANYLQQAIKMENSDSLKTQYYLDLAVINYTKLNQYQQARNYAFDAIKLKENSGKPYLLIGDIYAAYSSKYGKTSFEHSTLYWLAVDYYKKAKKIDASTEKLANEKIEYYQEHFPDSEDVFFNGLAKGQTYKIGDWINETTTVRTR